MQRRFAFIAFFLTSLAFAKEILIGSVFPLTGAEATFGVSASQAIELAVEQINQQGGIHGASLRVKILDDQGKPEEAALAITRLITQDHAAAILGEITSSATLAMAPIAQSHRVPLVSPGATHPKVTTLGDFIFRTCFVDSFQGRLMAKFLNEHLKVKTVAILKDVKSDYSIGLADAFKSEWIQRGGSIVSEQTYMAGDIDFRAQLTNLRSKKPDFVYVPGYYTDIGLLVRQARELGIQTPFGGGDGWDSPKIVEIGGSSVEGSYFSNHYSKDAKSPKTRAFVAAYQKAYGVAPDAIAAATFDALEVLVEGMKRAKNPSGPELRDAILATRKHVGVTGEITLNGHRDPVKSGVILKIDRGKQTYVTTIRP